MVKAHSIKITVVGMGYVGLSISVLLSQYNEVTVLDINDEKVKLLNNRISPLRDELIEKYLKEKKLNLRATTDEKSAYSNAEYVVIAVPTNFNFKSNSFDTAVVESVIERVIEVNPKATIVIKSTVPVGFTKRIKTEKKSQNLIFCPEFLRETKALYDCIHPSRVIISAPDIETMEEKTQSFANILKPCIEEKLEIMYMDSCEAEAVKLFSNAFLAMRVSFFNELDTYANIMGLRTESLINGVCSDPRIGNWYNNPSFGYGGYCLPKDSKQLLSSFGDVPQKIISAIVESNYTRKEYIANQVLEFAHKNVVNKCGRRITVGIHRLTMKSGSDNFRESSIYDVIDIIEKNNVQIIVYEPMISSEDIKWQVVNCFEDFKGLADVIVTNRYDSKLESVKQKIFTRDIFLRD